MSAFFGAFGEAFIRVRPDTSLFRQETQVGVTRALTGAGLGGGAVGSALRVGGITAGLTAFAFAAKEAIGGAAQLEEELNVFEVVAGASADEMERVSEQAKALGADLTLPAVSAGDAAQAFTELARGGLDVQDVLGGAKGVLQLAAAANLEVADAAQIAARALTTFRLPGEEAATVANLLVGAANAATGEVGDMAQALQQSGAVAAQFGLTVDDTVTAISLLAKSGVVGSDAGTSLRTTLLRLIPSSKEASDVMRALGVDITDSVGNFLPLGQIFEQFRQSLDGLTEAQRQQVLETIFGSDAIRAATILANEGAAGYEAMAEAVTRSGQAEEAAAARSEGLAGAWRGLKSQAETLGTTLGEIVVPGLTAVVQAASGGIGAVNDLVRALQDLNDVELPDWLGGGDLGENFWEPLDRAVGRIDEVFGRGAENDDPFKLELQKRRLEELGSLRDSMFDLRSPDVRDIAESLVPQGLTAKDRIEFRQAGERLGRDLIKGVSVGVISAEQEAVNAAQKTLAAVLREGREAIRETIQAGEEAVREAIRQGREATRLAAVDARVNLISLGQELSTSALQLLEEGPLARRIDALRLRLDRSQTGTERRQLGERLRDAELALRAAEQQAQVAGRLTPAQQAATQRFLEPFRRDVKDAKAALGEFATEGVIDRLQKQAEEQKRTVQQGIADLVIEFNKGGLTLAGLNVKLADLLRRTGVEPFGIAGTKLGLSFREKWLAQWRGVVQQAAEIVAGIKVPQIGVESTVVSPVDVRRRAGETVAETRARAAEANREARENAAAREESARDALRRAQNANTRATNDLRTDGIQPLIAAINANTKAQSGRRPRPSVPEGTTVNR